MMPILRPALELISGAAYRAHPGDASLPLSRRFQNAVVLVVGGGGTAFGWTQRIQFERGVAKFEGPRSVVYKRSSPEWTQHLSSEAKQTMGWAILLVEQQWQAALAKCSASSLGARGVEQMLRVRDATADFGDDRISEDAIRVAVDHPTMEGAIVAGIRPSLLELLESEVRAAGFSIAAVRISTFALIERHLAQLECRRQSPDSNLVAFDGNSALLVGVREGAFDSSEGALSYLVNRSTSDVRAKLLKRLAASGPTREGAVVATVVGVCAGLLTRENPDAMRVATIEQDPILSALADDVQHDLRLGLEEMRTALPRWSRFAFAGGAAVALLAFAGIGVEVTAALQLQREIRSDQTVLARLRADHEKSVARAVSLRKQEGRARQIGEWVDLNFHGQALLHRVLESLPPEVALDTVSVQVAEGLPQARLKFVLVGTEDAQRGALRTLEAGLYHLGYEIGRREDPAPYPQRRGAVFYAWDLLIPNFGS